MILKCQTLRSNNELHQYYLRILCPEQSELFHSISLHILLSQFQFHSFDSLLQYVFVQDNKQLYYRHNQLDIPLDETEHIQFLSYFHLLYGMHRLCHYFPQAEFSIFLIFKIHFITFHFWLNEIITHSLAHLNIGSLYVC